MSKSNLFSKQVRWARAFSLLTLAGVALSCGASAAVDVVVPGKANPYLAGMPDGSIASGDTAPEESPAQVNGLNLSGSAVLTFSVAGSVSFGGGTPTDTPDGSPGGSHGEENGISGFISRWNTLVGVFLDDSQPDNSNAPASLDFVNGGVPGGLDYSSVSPALKQVFFIGDGITSTGTVQQIVVPEGATRLFLATTDGSGWYNNTGSFSVRVVSSTGTTAVGLPAVTLAVTGSTANGSILHFSGTTESNLAVRVQSSSTPSDEGSWVDLPDDNGAAMTEDANNPGSYSLNSTFYPAGNAVYFRAIASKPHYADSVSAQAGPFVLTRAVLSIAASVVTTSDTNAGTIAHIGDDVTYTLAWQNTGNATARNMKVVATIPTFFHIPQVIFSAKTTKGSKAVTLTTGDTFGLFVGQQLFGPDTPSGGAVITAITGHTSFTMSVPATGSDTFPTTFFYAAGAQQFGLGDLVFNQFGSYVPATSGSSNDAKVSWNVSDLEPGFTQSVNLTVHLASKVQVDRDLSLRKDYTVYGSTFQPPYSATGDSSGAASVSTRIKGPISFTMVPKSNSVAPGKLLTYRCTLANLSSADIKHAAAVVVVPDGMRYDDVYVASATSSVKSVVLVKTGKVPSPTPVLNYPLGGGNPQVVLDLGEIYPRGDKSLRDSIAFDITFQAQWIDSSSVHKISTIDYGATFFDPATFADPTTGKKTTQYGIFSAEFKAAAGTTPESRSSTDFISFIGDTTHEVALSKNDLGIVDVNFAGGVGDQPKLGLLKTVSDLATDTQDDGSGSVDTVQPGDKLTFILGAVNNGNSVAEDVYIQDAMPEHTSYVSKSAKFLTSSSSTKKSKLLVVPDSDGRHLRFEGVTLNPHDAIAIQYTVLVASGTNAPANGTFLDYDSPVDPNTGLKETSSIGSSSTPHTWPGLYVNGPLKVTGTIQFPQPIVSPLLPMPVVTRDVSATANTLTAFYTRLKTKTDPYPDSDVPLTSGTDPTSYVPGMQRFYIHYANTGSVAASGTTFLSFPLPAHTRFYRAGFVDQDKKADKGSFGYHLIETPSNTGVIPPAGANQGFLATSGTVTFFFKKLSANTDGDVMVEVIIGDDAVQQLGSIIGEHDLPVVISDQPPFHIPPLPRHSAQTPMPTFPIATPKSASSFAANLSGGFAAQLTAPEIPSVGILRVAPKVAQANANFDLTWVIFNYGDTDAPSPNFQFIQPNNTTFVQANFTNLYNGTFIVDTSGGVTGPGADLEMFWDKIPAHSAVAVTYTLKSSLAGGTITDATSHVNFGYAGAFYTTPTGIGIAQANAALPPGTNKVHSITGRPLHCFSANSTDVFIVDIGGGNIIAEGTDTVVGQGGGTVLTVPAGRMAVYGSSGTIPVGASTAAFILSHLSDGATLANINTTPALVIVPQGCTFVAPGNSILSAVGSGLISPSGGGIVAQGGGNIVAQGGGNIVAQGGGNIVAQGGGNIVAQGGGNLTPPVAQIVAQGGGNIVAQGAGNIVAQGAGNIVAQGGGNLLGSTHGSNALISTANGGIVAQGAGNIVAQGGGN